MQYIDKPLNLFAHLKNPGAQTIVPWSSNFLKVVIDRLLFAKHLVKLLSLFQIISLHL